MENKQKRILIVLAAILIGLLAALAVDKCNGKETTTEAAVPQITSTPAVVELHLVGEDTDAEIEEAQDIEKPETTPSQDNDTENNTENEEGDADASPSASDVQNSGFALTILKQNVSVAYGVDEKTLESTPGWLTTSAAPGEEGVCVIYGHRNRKHLLILKNIDYGDIIRVTMLDGKEYSYKVESIEILGSDEDLHIPTIDGAHILITTCYPFYYTGHAPQKFVVMGGLIR